MGKAKKKKIPKYEPNAERFDLVGNMEAVSSNEQTGLVASAPVTDYEYESYNEILPFSAKYFK